MSEVRFAQQQYWHRFFVELLIVCSIVGTGAIVTDASGNRPGVPLPAQSRIGDTFVVTQIPVRREFEQQYLAAGGMLRADYGDGARLIMVFPDQTVKVLSRNFYSACDPEISFDASHILFAGKRKPADNWNIFEMSIDGSAVRQITDGIGDCRSPLYQATLYTIVSDKPWYQLTFVGSERGALNEYGAAKATNLYSCKLDGSSVRRLTFNLSSDIDPFIMPDGRLLFASW